MRAESSVVEKGLATTSTAPRSSACIRVDISVTAVNTMTGGLDSRSLRTLRTSSPPRRGHGEVEEDQVHVTGVELVQRSLTVSGLKDGVALGRERPVQDRADPRLVVHHKQAGHAKPLSARWQTQ